MPSGGREYNLAMATLERALAIAAAAHAGQQDRQGAPYILHPLAVMQLVDDLDTKIVAILHDVVEDTNVTFEDLRQAGFAPHILAALELVTHQKGVPYADYVVAAKANPIARAVKLADLTDNTRIDRALVRPQLLERDLKRMQRYVYSYQFLTDQLSEADYRAQMQPVEK